jgi:hypothetical protein
MLTDYDVVLPPRRRGRQNVNGHIEERTLKNGKTSYRTVLPVGTGRNMRKTTRAFGSRAEAEAWLEHVQAAQLAARDVIEPNLTLPDWSDHDGVDDWRVDTAHDGWSSVVYYVRLPPKGHIKIGVTCDLTTRLRSFRMLLDDIELLAWEPGDCVRENEIHTTFARQRIPGTERFIPCDELMAYIDMLAARRDAPKVSA